MVTDAYPANSIAWWFGARERGCHILALSTTLGSDCSRLRKALAARRGRCSRRWAAARSEDGHTATARPLPAAYPRSQHFCLVPVRAAGHLELRCPHEVPRTAARRREHSMRPDGHSAAETAVKTLLPVTYRANIPTLTYGMLGTLLPSSKLRRISIRPSFAMRLVSLIQSVKSSTPTIKVMMRCQTILIEIWLRQLERSRR